MLRKGLLMVLKLLKKIKYNLRITQSYIYGKLFLKIDKIGKGFVTGFGIKKSKKNHVIIGNNVYIGHRVYLACDLDIGNDVLIASNVAFVGGDHRFNIKGKKIKESGRDIFVKIVIENDVWIGHGAIILKNLKIGKGSIIGAGSVLTKDVEPYSIYAGNPAKFIRKRFSTEINSNETNDENIIN